MVRICKMIAMIAYLALNNPERIRVFFNKGL